MRGEQVLLNMFSGLMDSNIVAYGKCTIIKWYKAVFYGMPSHTDNNEFQPKDNLSNSVLRVSVEQASVHSE